MNGFKALILSIFFMSTQNALAHHFKTEQWTTKNGVQVVFYQAMEVPMLQISLAFAAGSAYDGEKHGLSALTARMLNQGNAGKNADTLTNALADTGAQFDAETRRDMVTLNFKTLTTKEALTPSIHLLRQIINHPDFPDEAFKREQALQLLAIEQVDESPDEVANVRFFKTLYRQHPYAHPVNGALNTVKQIKRQDLIQFYKRYYVAHNAVLVLVGAVDSKQAHALAELLTDKLPKGAHAQAIAKAPQLSHAKNIAIPFQSSQTMLLLGQVGIDHTDPHYFPLVVGNYILGGGATVSRLGLEVREKRGLTYGINSQFTPMPGAGPFIISLSTQNKQANEALSITEQTLKTFVDEGPSPEELEAAKNYLTGSFPLSLSSNRSIANLLVRMAFYHLPDSYLDTYVTHVNAVTVDAIKQAFKERVALDKLLLVRVGQS